MYIHHAAIVIETLRRAKQCFEAPRPRSPMSAIIPDKLATRPRCMPPRAAQSQALNRTY